MKVFEDAPPKSKAEMMAMTDLPRVQTVRLTGTLGIHEEYPEAAGLKKLAEG